METITVLGEWESVGGVAGPSRGWLHFCCTCLLYGVTFRLYTCDIRYKYSFRECCVLIRAKKTKLPKNLNAGLGKVTVDISAPLALATFILAE